MLLALLKKLVGSSIEMVAEEVFYNDLDSSAGDGLEHMEKQTSSSQTKTSSVAFNVYGDGNSRSNSVDYHCTPYVFRRSSMDTTGLQCLNTSILTRTPLESTPLMSVHAGASVSPGDVLNESKEEIPMDDSDQEQDYGSVRLRRRDKHIDYALFHRTGFK